MAFQTRAVGFRNISFLIFSDIARAPLARMRGIARVLVFEVRWIQGITHYSPRPRGRARGADRPSIPPHKSHPPSSCNPTSIDFVYR
jgi:hypothetical protein